MNQIAVGAVAGAIASRAARRLSFDSTNSRVESSSSSPNQKNVGILGIEVYTPSTFISQRELEKHSGVSEGKFTLGLGQEGLAVCGDCEDVNSLALTVTQSLLEK